MCSTQKMSQDELRRAIVSIQMDATIDESEKAARRQALLTGKWKPGDGKSKKRFFFFFFRLTSTMLLFLDASPSLSFLSSLLRVFLLPSFDSKPTTRRWCRGDKVLVQVEGEGRMRGRERERKSAREGSERERERETKTTTTSTSGIGRRI